MSTVSTRTIETRARSEEAALGDVAVRPCGRRRDTTYLYVRHDSFICVTRLIGASDMTHSYVCHSVSQWRDMTHLYV